MMTANLMRDIICLAFTKKDFRKKIIYLLAGIIFVPLLISEKRKLKGKNCNASNASLAGDDVYPLF